MSIMSQLFNSTIDIYRLTESKDSIFSPVNTFTAYLDKVPCRIQEEESFEPVQGGAKRSLINYNIYLDGNTDILLKDIVVIDSETYEVIELEIEGNDDTYLRVTTEKRSVILSDVF